MLLDWATVHLLCRWVTMQFLINHSSSFCAKGRGKTNRPPGTLLGLISERAVWQ